jgi:hypothetical protein
VKSGEEGDDQMARREWGRMGENGGELVGTNKIPL